MNGHLLAFTIAAMEALVPGTDHAELGAAVSRVVEAEAPLFADDEDRLKTASFYVALLYRESRFDNRAIGDKGRSFCAGQILLGQRKTPEGWTGKDLLADPNKCMTVVSRMLRESFHVCRRLPVSERMALYARGSCSNARGRQLSRDRYHLAKRVHDATLAAIGGES